MTIQQLVKSLLTFLIIVISLIGWIWSRVNNLREEFITKELCERGYGALKERLDKGDHKFLSIEKKLDNMSEVLTEVRTMVKLIAEKGS